MLDLKLAIRSPRSAAFEQHVVDISSPGHHLYGRHLTQSEVNEFMQPKQHVIQLIQNWISSAGAATSTIKIQGQRVALLVTVAEAEQLLNTKFFHFHRNKRNIIRTLQYSVPSNLKEDIQMIQPTTYFGTLKPHFSSISGESRAIQPPPSGGVDMNYCSVNIIPQCLQELYGMGKMSTTAPVQGNSLGISGYLDQYARFKDWVLFSYNFAQDVYGHNFSVTLMNNGQNSQSLNYSQDSKEANLDVSK